MASSAGSERRKENEERVGNTATRAPAVTIASSVRPPFLQLAQVLGNRAIGRLIQTRLDRPGPDDPLEREADRVADVVMRTAAPTARVVPERENQRKSIGQVQFLQAKPAGSQAGAVPSPLEDEIARLRGQGQPLPETVRAYFEPRFGYDFSQVRMHTDSHAAQLATRLHAQAFASGQDIFFGASRFQPQTAQGGRLLAHELTHTIQQTGWHPPAISPLAARSRAGVAANRMSRALPAGEMSARPVSPPSVGRAALRGRVFRKVLGETEVSEEDVESEELVGSQPLLEVQVGRRSYRVGDAAGPNLLMAIDRTRTGSIVFRWFAFAVGRPMRGTWRNWDFLAGAATIGLMGGTSAAFAEVGRQLPASEWRNLWPNPVPELLGRFEAGKIALPDKFVLYAYRGMIRSEAQRSLDANEAQIDALLSEKDRVARLEEFAAGLYEASLVRDALVRRGSELKRSLSLSQQQFHLGLPKRQLMAGLEGPQRMRAMLEEQEVVDALPAWLSVFPLLTRLQTPQINAGRVEALLREIKANIIATRAALVGKGGRPGTLDPWELANVRTSIAPQLGKKATGVIEREETSRQRWGWVKAGAAVAAGIALVVFVPGGAFIDLAIGFAIAADAWQSYEVIGKAANTSLHVDQGLMSQAQARGAYWSAVLSTVFAVLGTASMAFRVLRLARAQALARRAAAAERGAQGAKAGPLAGATDEELEAAIEGATSPRVTGGKEPKIAGARVPTGKKPRLEAQDIPRLAGETLRMALVRLRTIIGRKLSDIPAVRAAWDRARAYVLQGKTLDASNYADLYKSAQKRFWEEVRSDKAATKAFLDAGFEFPKGAQTAARLRGVRAGIPEEEIRISLDHIKEKAVGTNWRFALDADNLELTFHNPNAWREVVQMRHPELRP